MAAPGFAHLGVPPSGAADPTAFELGNRLVGNPPGAAALEATLDGPVLRFDAPATIALTGATQPAIHTVVAGEVLEVGRCVTVYARTSACAAGSTSRRCSGAARPTS